MAEKRHRADDGYQRESQAEQRPNAIKRSKHDTSSLFFVAPLREMLVIAPLVRWAADLVLNAL
jgi:hypothetical protein